MKFGHPVPQITANTQRTSLSKPQLKHQPMHQLLVHQPTLYQLMHQLMQFNQIFLQVHKRSGQVSASHLGFVSTRAMVTTMAPRSSAQIDAHQRASARNLLWHMDPGALGLMRLASGWWSLLGDATASMKFGHPVPHFTANTQRTSLGNSNEPGRESNSNENLSQRKRAIRPST